MYILIVYVLAWQMTFGCERIVDGEDLSCGGAKAPPIPATNDSDNVIDATAR